MNRFVFVIVLIELRQSHIVWWHHIHWVSTSRPKAKIKCDNTIWEKYAGKRGRVKCVAHLSIKSHLLFWFISYKNMTSDICHNLSRFSQRSPCPIPPRISALEKVDVPNPCRSIISADICRLLSVISFSVDFFSFSILFFVCYFYCIAHMKVTDTSQARLSIMAFF